MRVLLLSVLCFAVLASVGCGSDGSSDESQREARQQAALEAQRSTERRQARQLRRAEARQRRQAARQQARREAARQAEPASECDPSYSGACLDPYASDYDCAGGSGDGPEYTGPVAVVGEDHYGLDSDSDGYGCE